MEPNNKIVDGKLNALGMDISITDLIGSKIIDKYIEQLPEEDLQLIFDAIDKEIFGINTVTDKKYFITTKETDDRWNNYREDSLIWKVAKNTIQERYGKVIQEKVDEILNSDEYKERAEKIAEELVDYASEAYKNDLKESIYRQMVQNVTDPMVSVYNNKPLRDLIQTEIANYNYTHNNNQY